LYSIDTIIINYLIGAVKVGRIIRSLTPRVDRSQDKTNPDFLRLLIDRNDMEVGDGGGGAKKKVCNCRSAVYHHTNQQQVEKEE